MVSGQTAKPNVTLIARKCGVSKMTVSRVLRNQGNVSPATRQLVLDVAERAGFVPTGRYTAENSQAAKNYYVLFQEEHSLKDAYFSGIILSIQHELFAKGNSCSLGVIKEQYPDFLKLANILRSEDVKGILVVGESQPGYINALQAIFPNVVLIDYPGSPEIEKPYNAVCIDNVFGANLAMRRLFKLGRKRILLVTGREGHYFSEDLRTTYIQAMTKKGLQVDPELIVHGDFHIQGGFRAVSDVLKKGIKFDAVFSNDEMACGALRALSQAGVSVPGEVSVIGYDGLPMGEAVSPALTTIHVDRAEIGRLAVKRLLAIQNEPLKKEDRYEKISVFPKLIIRESCGGK